MNTPTATEPRWCSRCDKRLSDTKVIEVHIDTAGRRIPTGMVVPVAEDQGWLDVGPECIKHYPRRTA
jgi:hypothetical protein